MQADEKLLAPKSGFFGGDLTTHLNTLRHDLTKMSCRHKSVVLCECCIMSELLQVSLQVQQTLC